MRRFLLIGVAALAFVAYAYIQTAGSAVVVDETDGVVSAVVTNGRLEQPLVRLWSGYFYAIPDLEGHIEVRCRDGSRMSWGYVTGNIDTKLRIVGDRPCQRIIEDHRALFGRL
jgi:hypothetical protein